VPIELIIAIAPAAAVPESQAVGSQRGEAEIDAIEIGKEIGQHQKRNQPSRDRANSGSLKLASGVGRGKGDGGHPVFFPSFFFSAARQGF
jgi:hypothetical protein